MKRNIPLSAIITIVLLFSFLYAAGGWQPARGARPLAGDLVIYADALAGWENWSWDTTLNLGNLNPVHSGNASISARFDQPWAGLYLHAASPVSTTGFGVLRFWIHGGTAGGQQLRVVANGDSSAGVYTVSPSAGVWTQVDVPLASLGSPANLQGLFWQDTTGGAQAVFFLDDISLVNDGSNPPPGTGPALSVDAAANRHAISPYIYGMNFTDEALAAELSLPVRRWGGNSTTRFNWQTDTTNRASDWYFENIANDNPYRDQLPNGSETDLFIEQDRRTGTRTILTLPLIGWTPKVSDQPRLCGFNVDTYGAQQSTDPWAPKCGNGLHVDGSPITGNDPHDTSAEITPIDVQAWINHLTTRYGNAAAGGVQFYSLDNEPMLWNSTHRDVHPAPTSYDELRDRTYQYAPAIKASDPTAQTLGPVLYGWTAYFYSALDAAPGGSWWNNPLDRLAHSNTPFIEWYLQQMQAYEQAHGQRILDYVDVHYYTDAEGVSLSPAGSTSTQALRLRSTRSLWDPTYVDESWIGLPVRLIPRMREWVQNNYPGTRLAITEYNWGALEHINGALAQADVLGIFGREGLDLATLWSPPTSAQPGAYAFRMYLNYDGAGSRFGQVSIQAASADQDKLSIYAAQRAADNALTIMVINKTSDNLASPITLANFQAGLYAQVYRYSSANLSAISHESNFAVSGNSISADFPSNSITLIVIPPAFPGRYVYLPVAYNKSSRSVADHHLDRP